MEFLKQFINIGNTIVWDWFLMYGLVFTGLFFTFYLGFPQIRRFGKMFKVTFGGLKAKEEEARKDPDEISAFAALSVAIAAQVGTGNIGGVASAIMAGGPGAIFWMWISAIFGMSTIFSEALMAQKYRHKTEDGSYVGGPAYYISKGLKNKKLGRFLAGFFAVAIVLALGFVGNMTQSNALTGTLHVALGGNIKQYLLGIVLAIIAGLVFIGGLDRISKIATYVVPVMAIIYVLAGASVLFKFRADIPVVFKMIFTQAFSSKALVGGAIGVSVKTAIQKGVARGLFSNEAGMGSTPHAHAVAKVNHPAEQGMTAMVGVFIDTMVVCTFTALLILITGANTIALESGIDGALVTQAGFGVAYGSIGEMMLAICLAFFAFTTIIGWYYFAETNIRYLFGDKGIRPYQIMVIGFIILGSVFSEQNIGLVWNIADFFNGIMVIPNIIALLFLAREVKELSDDYRKGERLGNIHYEYLE